MAELNLHLGRSVMVDAVNDSEEARQTRLTAASRTGSRLDLVHLVIKDEREHERRLRNRDRGLAHVGEPAWWLVSGEVPDWMLSMYGTRLGRAIGISSFRG